MKYRVTVAGQAFDIDLVEKEDGLYANGEKVALVARQGPLAALERSLGARTVSVAPGVEENVFDVQLGGGRVLACGVEDERARLARRSLVGGGAGHAGPKTIRAIMPGIVLKVAVEVGASVAVKDALLVVEAMKMQNELRAELAGKIAKIHVKPGQSVAAGAPLLEIHPAS
jgi:biotin carboxyl carrier protein